MASLRKFSARARTREPGKEREKKVDSNEENGEGEEKERKRGHSGIKGDRRFTWKVGTRL